MMGRLLFEIETPYLRTGYERLRDMAVRHKWLSGKNRTRWLFRLEQLESVSAVLGERPSFERRHLEALAPSEVEVPIESWKGESGFTVSVLPKIFRVVEHRKPAPGEPPKEVCHDVPHSNVAAAWEAVSKYPKGQRVKTRTVAWRICDTLRVADRFSRDSGSFDFAKFFGSRGSGYFPYFYYPMKVLDHYRVVKHHKSGYVERLSDDFSPGAEI